MQLNDEKKLFIASEIFFGLTVAGEKFGQKDDLIKKFNKFGT
jgi:hypothetical protein